MPSSLPQVRNPSAEASFRSKEGSTSGYSLVGLALQISKIWDLDQMSPGFIPWVFVGSLRTARDSCQGAGGNGNLGKAT